MTVWTSELANADLLDIWEYTSETWGVMQADAYIRAISERFVQLDAFPAAGRSVEEIRAGYRRIKYASHVIYYRPVPDGVQIVRILHERMDPYLHL
ncbi:type II toxin-antitoxin system RelE/ParE family toxin [Corynebacterium sp. TA-R-1]|uniref:Toxin n=1 Tax=Corynebacterium stercoris TaxID=2943490 RepID=A0ABT1G3Z6_9CORY|nr:type II toxin-antitoxin system RelE/ParE family toxin [Corynebacterium stercoris]